MVTAVEVDGETFTYTRQTTANAQGEYTVRVAYPGSYDTDNATATVDESAVTTDSTVTENG